LGAPFTDYDGNSRPQGSAYDIGAYEFIPAVDWISRIMSFIALVPSLYFNVKQYGVRGDGTTDDTTFIQNVITAASAAGGVVFFPPGTYVISSPLIINAANITIMGCGAASIILAKSTFTGAALIYTASSAIAPHIHIKDIKLQSTTSTYSSNPACDGIQLNSDVSNLIMENVDILYMNGWAIQTIDGSTGGTGYMRANGLYSALSTSGFHFSSVHPAVNQGGGFTITNCIADNCQNGDAYFLDGIGDNVMSNCQGYTVTGGSSLHVKGSVYCHFSTLDLGGGTPNAPCVPNRKRVQ